KLSSCLKMYDCEDSSRPVNPHRITGPSTCAAIFARRAAYTSFGSLSLLCCAKLQSAKTAQPADIAATRRAYHQPFTLRLIRSSMKRIEVHRRGMAEQSTGQENNLRDSSLTGRQRSVGRRSLNRLPLLAVRHGERGSQRPRFELHPNDSV